MKWLLLISLIGIGTQSFAKEASFDRQSYDREEKYDVSLKLGAVAGQVTARVKQNGETTEASFPYGGVSVGASLNRNVSDNLTSSLQGILVVDVTNSQVARQGFDVVVAYHVLGGAKYIARQTDFSSRVWRNSYSVSALLMGGLHNYSMTDKDSSDTKLSGSSLEVQSGLVYRQDLGESSSIGLSFVATVYTLPASTERVDAKGAEFAFIYGFLL